MSLSRMAFPAAFCCHASGVWSACRSSVEPQSVQNGCKRLARLLSFVQAPS